MRTSYAVTLVALAAALGFVAGQRAQKPAAPKPELYQARLIAITQPDHASSWKAHIKLRDGQLVPIDVGPGVAEPWAQAVGYNP